MATRWSRWTRGHAATPPRRRSPSSRRSSSRPTRATEAIVPVTIKGRNGDTVVEVDEGPRRDTTLETLAKLPPIFVKDGSHTAGNSPGVNGGRGALGVGRAEG